MGKVLAFDVEMVVVECCNCHVHFSMPYWMERERRRDHGCFYCPNGHMQYYSGKSDEEKLKEKLKAREKDLQAAQERERSARRVAEEERRSKIAYKGLSTRYKNRAEAGVCIHCNRSFEDLRRHMETKHPHLCRGEEEVDE